MTAAALARTVTVITVDCSCLTCGDAEQLVVGDLAKLPRFPKRCSRCGGSVLATGTQERQVRRETPFTWTDDDQPRRGRPLKQRTLDALLPMSKRSESHS